jgi:adenine-specific DNA-methyltransferase
VTSEVSRRGSTISASSDRGPVGQIDSDRPTEQCAGSSTFETVLVPMRAADRIFERRLDKMTVEHGSVHGVAWDPTKPSDWAAALGFAYVPLYGQGDPATDSERGVLLDGQKSSFHIFSTDDADELLSDRSLQESWSSNLTHSVGIDRERSSVVLRRWDQRPTLRKFALPPTSNGAAELVKIIKSAPSPANGDVVLHMLRAFRAVRALLSDDDPVRALSRFNFLLLASEAIELRQIDRAVLTQATSFTHLASQLGSTDIDPSLIAAIRDPAPERDDQNLPSQIVDYFLAPEPGQRYVLVPSLLMRHALGQLYQETHLVIESEGRQLVIPGFAPPSRGAIARRDIRFTPRSLARSLVESALQAATVAGEIPKTLSVLDPACGSGVFLTETIGALRARGYTGVVTLRGFDISRLSVDMARFALSHTARDARLEGLTIDYQVDEVDAFESDWGTPDIIVMNPPFMPWDSMTSDEQDAVRRVLGASARGRIDKAMAFVTKAAERAGESGVVASVLPAAILETDAGTRWREALAANFDLAVLGRFEGFGYFRASFVEPAFVVLRRRLSGSSIDRLVAVLVAQETFEDDSLRYLRRTRVSGGREPFDHSDGWDAYLTPQDSIAPTTWLPRRRSDYRLLELLGTRELPTVGELFQVRQGVRTGANDAFVLRKADLQALPRREHKYFRPAAGNSTIRDGHLETAEYVFYPYGSAEVAIASEHELEAVVPTYHRRYLLPNKAKLRDRAGLGSRPWWHLTWPRTWQYQRVPKIVSTYFGDRGSFAYDDSGQFVVVQGHGWTWSHADDPGESQTNPPPFSELPLPWAYVAVLNSFLFERILGAISPRVQGGQFNLSPRFVGRAPLPPLFDEARVLGELTNGLARFGRRIAAGEPIATDEQEELVARAYGVPMSVAADY